jgi:hypothetical protein
MDRAYSRHSWRTGHEEHIDLASLSLRALISLLSDWKGGAKKETRFSPRQAALVCQASFVVEKIILKVLLGYSIFRTTYSVDKRYLRQIKNLIL